MGIKRLYDEAWQALIKPGKSSFSKTTLTHNLTTINHVPIVYEDLIIPSDNQLNISGSFYHPQLSPNEPLDIVIYLHTRGGNRVEGLFLVPILLPRIGVVLFDFIGSGFSDGEYVTLGYKEAIDIQRVVDFMKEHHSVRNVVLWGRSMGAVAAILYASKNNAQVTALILDSPFSCFRRMIYDIITSRRKVPTCLIDLAMHFILKTVRNKTGINLYHIKPIDMVSKINLPCFYIVGHNDLISRPDKVKDLYLKTSSLVKEFHLTQGEHNSIRQKEIILKAVYFVLKTLSLEKLVVGIFNI